MKLRTRLWLLSLTTFTMLLATAPRSSAQDNGNAGEPIVSSIDPSTLTYDLLVDGSLSADQPANKKYKTLLSAYNAATAGTIAKQTVIGIMPNVYIFSGLSITKNYITLRGITNNRRSVVLANGNGTVITVNDTGFTAENLTVLNYHNVDYQYPGDSSKNINKVSAVETQATAMQMSGDKHTFRNVAFLSRLDTTFVDSARAYFANVFIEGTSDFIGCPVAFACYAGPGTVSYWENSEVQFPAGFEPVVTVSGAVFNNTKFTSTRGMSFYKDYGTPAVVLNSTLPPQAPGAAVSWVDTGYQAAPTMPNLITFTYHNKDTNGNPAVIIDSSTGAAHPTFNIGREMSDQTALAFNPWNLLRATPTGVADNWDPSGTQALYDGQNAGNLIYRMTITGGAQTDIRTGGAGATVSATVSPARAPDQTIHWSTTSSLVSLSNNVGASITVTAQNPTTQAQYVPVTATAVNGYYAVAWFYVEPHYISPPVPTATPTLGAPTNGTVTVTYPLNLGGLQDQSLVSWFLCDNASGANPRPVAVSRGNVPLNTYPLTLGAVGKYIEASIQPKSNISDPGPAIVVIGTNPILVTDIPSTTAFINFRNFPTNNNTTFVSGLWTVLGTWTSQTSATLPYGYSFRAAAQNTDLLYQQDGKFGDMQVDVIYTPEKTMGQGFAIAGGPTDSATHADIYIKYDPRTKNGYSLRFWRTSASASQCLFQFYKIVNGAGSPLNSQQQLTGVIKPDTFITLQMIGTTLTATGHNNLDQEVLSLTATAPTNNFGGGGVNWGATTTLGNSAAFGTVQLSYPGTTTLITKAQLFKTSGGYQASVTVTNTGTGTAQNVQLSTATLGTASGTVTPIPLGNILAGASTSFVVNFPASAGADGASTVEKFAGTYTGGTFGGSMRVVLP